MTRLELTQLVDYSLEQQDIDRDFLDIDCDFDLADTDLDVDINELLQQNQDDK